MAGYSTSPFRKICRQLGAGVSFTELVSVEGMKRGLARTMAYLETMPGESPVGAHLFGTDPAAFAAAARTIETLGRFSLIDINCGCPVPKVVRRGAGAALMRRPGRIAEIVRAVRGETALPVTVKTRIGFAPGDGEVEPVIESAAAAGAAAVFLHGRYAVSRHAGPADLFQVSEAGLRSPIPVYANGGIASAAEALSALARPGVAGVMIGRGAIGNPWIFAASRAALAGWEWSPPGPGEILAVLSEHLELETARHRARSRRRRRDSDPAETIACRAFLPHLIAYLRGVTGAKELSRLVCSSAVTAAVVIAEARRLLGEAVSSEQS